MGLARLSSLPLEPLAIKLQRPAVLCHGADQLVSRPIWQARLNLDGHRDLRAQLPHQMSNDLVGDTTSVTPDPRGVDPY